MCDFFFFFPRSNRTGAMIFTREEQFPAERRARRTDAPGQSVLPPPYVQIRPRLGASLMRLVRPRVAPKNGALIACVHYATRKSL